MGSTYLYRFPNFPNSAEPDGLGSFGKLGNLYLQPFPNFPMAGVFWEIRKYVPQAISHFPISQMVLSQMRWCLLGNWEFGKWIGRDLFMNKGCVYKHGPGAPINVPIVSPCLFINARCVYKHGFGRCIVPQNVIIIVNANTH